MKQCNKCLDQLPVNKFHKDRNKKDGLHTICIDCRKIYAKENQLKIQEYNKKYQINYQQKNYEKLKDKKKIYILKTKDSKKEYDKERYKNNKEKIKSDVKIYYQKNQNKVRESSKNWRLNNKEKYNKNRRKWHKERYEKDSLFKLKRNLRCRINHAFKTSYWNKKGRSSELLGCNFKIAHDHLESLFEKGMTWQNHGEWEIDHIIPFASAKTEEELIKLCHYKNLQPLWREENRRKKDRILITEKGEYKLLLI